jgi:hypothetical protein
MSQETGMTKVIEKAMALPAVRVDREKFLRKKLNKYCTQEQMDTVISRGSLHADIPIETLDKIAHHVIKRETLKITAMSIVAGLPDRYAMMATVPDDLQYYVHVLRTAQKLAYIYGYNTILTDQSALDAGTQFELNMFLGVMSGVDGANKTMGSLFGKQTAKLVAKNAAKQAASDKILKSWRAKLVKKKAVKRATAVAPSTLSKTLAKAVPIVGGIASGGLTFATFKPMARRLQKHLSELARMSPNELEQYSSEICIEVDEDYEITETEQNT